jgi:hypothetical protein
MRWFESLKGREHSGNIGISGRLILKFILKKYSVKMRTGLM